MKATTSPELKGATADTKVHENIQELVEHSAAVIAHYWPMTTFVHHNPIRSLENLNFHEAVKVANRLIGGRGYLANEQYRKLLKVGRIGSSQVDAALEKIADSDSVEIGGKTIRRFEVLRTHLLEGITPPADESVATLIDRDPNSSEIKKLASTLGRKTKRLSAAERIGREVNLLTWCDQELHNNQEWLVNKELIKWCEAFLDEGHAPLPMPYRERGFYSAWKSLVSLEWSPCGIKSCRRKVAELPESPEEALMAHLDALAIPEELRQDYLSLELTSLCGWASFIHWRAENAQYPWQAAYPIDLIQYLAVRLFYVREVIDMTCKNDLGIEGKYPAIASYVRKREETQPDITETKNLASAWRLVALRRELSLKPEELASTSSETLNRILDWMDEFPESEHGRVWLEAHEATYQEPLSSRLRDQSKKIEAGGAEPVRPLAQAMFCIDVRSEPFRRHLESVGNYETIGFAGFFGIPMRCQSLDQHHLTDQLPAIVAPKYTVHEVVRNAESERFKKHNAGLNFMKTIQETLHDMKSHVLTPYVMVESLGWLFGVQIFGRTLFPSFYRKARKSIRTMIAPPVGTEMTADRNDDGLGLTHEEQCATIEGVLKTMGLTSNFARLVVVCGHTSTSDNNPYEAALNCGACGGNSGKPNGRLLAAMANKPSVRKHLKENGIVVPDDTHFIGGVHDTTTDSVDLFDLEDLPATHKEDLQRLKKDLKEAARKNNRERCIRLPGVGSNPSPGKVEREISRRAGDWSETRPEWGLASNAAFIIANRSLTKELDLGGRTFLNSHDYRIDTTGALLEGLMMGPMVVGQWINAEHYFSATDTEVFGSGSKIYHNVVGRMGIMSGPQSDLRTGLAWQSMVGGELTYHDPLRLFVVIEAPRERIQEIVERQPVLKQLCDNEWIHLVAVDHAGKDKVYRFHPVEGWLPECSNLE